MAADRLFREKLKNNFITVGLTTAAVLFVVGDIAGDIISAFFDSKSSINRALYHISRHQSKSLSVSEYLEILKEASGINLTNTIHRLKKKRLVSESDGEYALTPLGRQLVCKLKDRLRYRLNWDGKWRLITFDVPEKQRRGRDWLRDILRLHEYKQLHKSVFLGKFPLPEKIYRDIYKRKLMPFIHILTIGEIDDENKLL